jgi:4'-phosphopantetheinyl transferase
VTIRLRVAKVPAVLASTARAPDPDEARRLLTIASPLRRQQFLAGRILLRRLLDEVATGAADNWDVSADAGPVRLTPRNGSAPLYASISHRRHWVAVAVGRSALGIDLEVAAPAPNSALVDRVAFALSVDEAAALVSLPETHREARWRSLWTLKEAWLKCHRAPFDLGRLGHIGAAPAPSLSANSVSWGGPELTLSLCCATPSAWPARPQVKHFAGQVSPSLWRVEHRTGTDG